MVENKHSFNDGTSEIISAALEVHKTLGPGFMEVIYQRALFHEMKERVMEFSREEEIDVFYKEKKVGLLLNFGAKKLEIKRFVN